MHRDARRWSTPFGKWVSAYTVRRLIADLGERGVGVTLHAPYDWLSGRTRPRPSRAVAIADLSGGRITLDEIYRQRAEIAGHRQTPGCAGLRKDCC